MILFLGSLLLIASSSERKRWSVFIIPSRPFPKACMHAAVYAHRRRSTSKRTVPPPPNRCYRHPHHGAIGLITEMRRSSILPNFSIISFILTEVQSGVFLVIQVGDTQTGLEQQPGDGFKTHNRQKQRTPWEGLFNAHGSQGSGWPREQRCRGSTRLDGIKPSRREIARRRDIDHARKEGGHQNPLKVDEHTNTPIRQTEFHLEPRS